MIVFVFKTSRGCVKEGGMKFMVVLEVMLHEVNVSCNMHCNTFASHVPDGILRATPLSTSSNSIATQWQRK